MARKKKKSITAFLPTESKRVFGKGTCKICDQAELKDYIHECLAKTYADGFKRPTRAMIFRRIRQVFHDDNDVDLPGETTLRRHLDMCEELWFGEEHEEAETGS